MSIPRIDPKFTMSDLNKLGEKLHDAAYSYWEGAQKAGISGAVIWVSYEDGSLNVFTRGEYKAALMQNIDRIGPTRSFGASVDE